jgi:tRNA/tmRNA/rRNA uracil-C5-methylase (TrmA/RlmC/RlmD family)
LRIPPKGWEVPPDSFFQNNFFLLPQLVEVVRERLRDSGSRHLADVYCGVGFFSIELSDQLDSFVGIELDRLAIKAARRNAVIHGRINGEFRDGSAEDLLPQLLTAFQAGKTTVLLDPPRKGCATETLQLLRQAGPAQVLYVSCHPATAARDLNILCQDGVFELKQVVPLDMFPHTQHIECVSDLRYLSSVNLPG